jgi:hypothetical protein
MKLSAAIKALERGKCIRHKEWMAGRHVQLENKILVNEIKSLASIKIRQCDNNWEIYTPINFKQKENWLWKIITWLWMRRSN